MTEALVRKMTGDTPVWGPSREDLNDLCALMDSFEPRHDTMKVCWEILKNEKSTVTQLKKAMRILDHMMNNGTQGGIAKVRANILEHVKVFAPLKTYKITRLNGAEIGTTVRELAVKIEANILGKTPPEAAPMKQIHIILDPKDVEPEVPKKEEVAKHTPMMVEVEEEVVKSKESTDLLFDSDFFKATIQVKKRPPPLDITPLTFDDFFNPKVDVPDHDFASLRRPREIDEIVTINPNVKK